jgi:DNA-directed RNA polymerase subunit K/omega
MATMAVAKRAVQLQKKIKMCVNACCTSPNPLFPTRKEKKKGKTSYGVSRREKNWKKKLLVQKIQT